ncbi:substrate-binding domain-containing protein [Streptosporangium lutulentum]|nr:substrate-binding domain-containing protein [Streptosporangium lutulentum]
MSMLRHHRPPTGFQCHTVLTCRKARWGPCHYPERPGLPPAPNEGEGGITALCSIPADVSIAGYDNTLLAALPNIALTSVDQDGAVMGRTAGRLLLERIEGRMSAVRFSVTPKLVIRRSTAPPPM